MQVKKFLNAINFHKLGKFAEAKNVYIDILKSDPDNFDVLHMLGVVTRNLKQYAESEHYFSSAKYIKLDPYILANYALLLQDLHRFDEAINCFKEAVSIKTDFALAHYNCGLTLQKLGRIDEALANFNQAIAVKPDYAEAYVDRGNTLKILRRFDEALLSYNLAFLSKKNYVDALINRGAILCELKRFDDALESYQIALSIKPDSVGVLNNRGNTLKELRRYNEALESFDLAIHIKPDYAEAYSNRGTIYRDLGRFDEALADFSEAVRYKENYFNAHSNFIFVLTYLERSNFSTRLEEAKKFGSILSKAFPNKFDSWKKLNSKLRIGFVSGDFNSHPVGFFFENVLSSFDRSKLELFAYTASAYEDSITNRLKNYFHSYKSFLGLSDVECANLVYSDSVNILIDLSGHTAGNRLPVFAIKPAPIQISWLGYSGTTGVPEIDYVLGDPYVTPPDEECHFSEKVKRLSETYYCFTPPKADIQIYDLPALTSGRITFGCFNNFTKVSADVISLWAKVLSQVDGSQLFLKAKQLSEPRVVEDTRALLRSLGVSSERLLIEGPSNRVEYLSSYNKVDIALDPFPYPGGTTSVEALWMGVPVLTKKGNSFIAHNGETIAHNSGQADWIAEDEADYIAKAIHFSSDLQALAKLRSGLRAQVLASPLFDAERFARNFEKAMFEIWEDYKNGK